MPRRLKCAGCQLGEHCNGEDENCWCECTTENDNPIQMCATCGCLIAEAKHGDARNITVSEFKAAATKTAVAPGSTSRALQNIRRTLKARKRK